MIILNIDGAFVKFLMLPAFKVKVYRDFSLYTGRPCTSILKKYYEGKLKNNQRGGMKLVSISAVRLVIIVMVAYVIVLV